MRMAKRNLRLIILALIIVSIVTVSILISILIIGQFNGKDKEGGKENFWKGGTLFFDIPDFGPGTITIEAVKVIYSWEEKDNFEVLIRDGNGETVVTFIGEYSDGLEGREDGKYSNYFTLFNRQQVLRKGDYRVEAYGLRKDSRDSMKVSVSHTYVLTKNEIMTVGGKCRWTFEDDEPTSIWVFAIKNFPDGAKRGNIVANLTDQNGKCIDSYQGTFLDGPSREDDEDEDEPWNDDSWLLTWLDALSKMNDYDDHYVLNHGFYPEERNNVTLEVTGLRTNSRDEISVKIDGEAYDIGPFEIKGRTKLKDDLILALLSPGALIIFLFIIFLIILFGLVIVLRTIMAIPRK